MSEDDLKLGIKEMVEYLFPIEDACDIELADSCTDSIYNACLEYTEHKTKYLQDKVNELEQDLTKACKTIDELADGLKNKV